MTVTLRTLQRIINLALIGSMTVMLLTGSRVLASESAHSLSKVETLRLGEQMYRKGILPSGNVMPAYIRGDIEVDSTAFSCSSCHMRAGLGSVEGGVVTPPTTGTKLYKPYRRPPSLNDIPDRSGRIIYAKTVLERPAYTREGLAGALRYGVDPAGQTFNDVMPRYPLSDHDMTILIDYLEMLSSEPSPGIDGDTIRFATIVTEDVSQDDRQALLQPLTSFISEKNQQQQLYIEFLKSGYSPTLDMKNAFFKTSLEVWELKGAPVTWQTQLANYYAKQPVFAVLGGISNQDWRPIHDFCESREIPCLFPITDFPVISDSGWYTFYFNKGYAQEGEAVARHLNRLDTRAGNGAILQVVQDIPVGRGLAAGFQNTWRELGHPDIPTVTLTTDQLQNPSFMKRMMDRYKPHTLLLWTDAGVIPQLPALMAQMPKEGMIFSSSTSLGRRCLEIPDSLRDNVYLTFPHRMSSYVGPKTGGYDAKIPTFVDASTFGDRRIMTKTTTMLRQIIVPGLTLIFDNRYRDHLLDVMSMQMDLVVRDYERLSFGPGQRYASKGCFIIQLGLGKNPAIIQRSDWVIH